MLAVVWKKIETKSPGCTYAVQNIDTNAILQATFQSSIVLYPGQQIEIEILGLTNNGVLVAMDCPAQSAAQSAATAAAESAAQYTLERQAKKPKNRPHFS